MSMAKAVLTSKYTASWCQVCPGNDHKKDYSKDQGLTACIVCVPLILHPGNDHKQHHRKDQQVKFNAVCNNTRIVPASVTRSIAAMIRK